MTGLLLSILLAHGGFFVEHLGDRVVGRVVGRIADRVLTVHVTSPDEEASGEAEAEADSEADSDDLEVLPPVPPGPPVPQRVKRFSPQSARELPHFTEKRRDVPTAQLLHRIAETAGWTMTLVGSPKDRIDVDIQDADPREALRQVLKQSGAMGVLKNDKLVVVATPDAGGAAGMLIEKMSSRQRVLGEHRGIVKGGKRNSRDVVRVFQGD